MSTFNEATTKPTTWTDKELETIFDCIQEMVESGDQEGALSRLDLITRGEGSNSLLIGLQKVGDFSEDFLPTLKINLSQTNLEPIDEYPDAEHILEELNIDLNVEPAAAPEPA